MTPAEELSRAIAITAVAFDGDNDKGGTPYIMHCLHVMEKAGKKTGQDPQIKAIAVMHDLLEDKPEWTSCKLAVEGFSERVIDGVVTMTHPRDEPYMDYIKRVATNDDTRIVKMADLKHNSDPMRMKGITTKDTDRIAKYHEAFHYLKNYK